MKGHATEHADWAKIRENAVLNVVPKTNHSIVEGAGKKPLEYARQLIVLGELNVNEICHLVGFEVSSSFIRMFRNSYGCTPGNLGCGKS